VSVRPHRPRRDRVAVIGVPTSAGAFAPGQEEAPAALRRAGLIEKLRAAEVDVADHGDAERWRWRPDPSRPRAQNLAAVRQIALDTGRRVASAVEADKLALVIGGDCTIELGTVLGCRRGSCAGLIYFDLHPDLNIPEQSLPGALDWMGAAHMLGVDGAVPELTGIGGTTPLIRDDEILFFGYGPAQARPFERRVIEQRELAAIPRDRVAADPEDAAEQVLSEFGSRFDRILIHFDVDVIDFTDAPLSQNPGRNEGLPFELALRALRVLVGSDRLGALTVTEVNPLHGAEDGSTIERLASALADCFAGRARSAATA
jgi:arginase